MKIFYYGASPAAHVGTGHAAQARGILEALSQAGHEIDGVGYNDPGSFAPTAARRLVTVPPWTHAVDPYGARVAYQAIRSAGPYDAVFCLGDIAPLSPIMLLREILEGIEPRPRVVLYLPLDSKPTAAAASRLGALNARVYACTEFGHRWLVSLGIDVAGVIPHGIEQGFFGKPDREAAAAWRASYGLEPEAFLFSVIATNTLRKNLPCIVNAFRCEIGRPAALYLHTPRRGAVDLDHVCEALESRAGSATRIITPAKLPPWSCSPKEIGTILAGSDALVFASLAEGWCLPMTEAFAMRCPVIAPAHSAFFELGAERAQLYPCEPRTLWNPELGDFCPWIDPIELRRAMIQAARPRLPGGSVAAQLERARAFAESLAWDRVGPLWARAFEGAT